MNKLLVVFAAFIAFVAANQAITVIPLTSGVAYTGVLPGSNNIDYFTQVFSFYVWPNATFYNISVLNLNSSDYCEYVEGLYRNDGAPCYEGYDSENWYCSNTYSSISDVAQAFYPGYREYLSEFKTGATVYFGVARYDDENYDCSYSITVTQVATCTLPAIATTTNLDNDITTTQCVTPTPFSSTGTSTFNITNPGTTSYFTLYTTQVPLRTGSITVTMNITDDEAEIFGNQYSAIGYSDDSKCSIGGGGGEGPYYIYSLVCMTPREGLFVFAVQGDFEFNGTISFTMNACPTGLGGYNCLFPEAPVYLNATGTTSLYIPYNNTFEYYNQLIFYIDVPVNYTGPDFYATFTSPQDASAYLGVRINGYPVDTDSGQEIDERSIDSEGTTFGLSQFDYVFAGRYYFSMYCEYSDGCNVTVNFNSTSVTSSSSSSGVSTTGSSGVSTTGSSGVSTTGSSGASTTSRTTAAGITTSIVTTRAVTTGSVTTGGVPPAATTAMEHSGFELIIPSVVLLLIALVF